MTEVPFEIDISGREHLEEWRPIPGWEGYYEASNCGRIRGVDRTVPTKRGGTAFIRGRIMGQRMVENGYLVVMMSKNSQYQNQLVHRLVLLSFEGVPPQGYECCHLNGVRTDNRLENLRWDTRSGNSVDQVKHGTHRNIKKTECDYGHAYTPENTYTRPGGQRNCRACKRKYQSERYRRLGHN